MSKVDDVDTRLGRLRAYLVRDHGSGAVTAYADPAETVELARWSPADAPARGCGPLVIEGVTFVTSWRAGVDRQLALEEFY